MKSQKLLGLPPLSVLLCSDLPSPDPGLWREAGRQIHRSGQSFRASSRLLPPALHCFYVISQPRCHGTEDGTSTLVLNDLLDDSLLVRHSCPTPLKCDTERNEPLPLPREERRGGVFIWPFYSELNWWWTRCYGRFTKWAVLLPTPQPQLAEASSQRWTFLNSETFPHSSWSSVSLLRHYFKSHPSFTAF